eukprot:TRINITY_DN2971_c0_g1_i1.p1 TRINITY_DN2971_c0_g1~~TRINITY_DN2971_c0_g1_i1.p1  ORF type:complete len:466 (+),score=-31.22 TRINITY_DN2971_c0_g1_i1:110-1507(+)
MILTEHTHHVAMGSDSSECRELARSAELRRVQTLCDPKKRKGEEAECDRCDSLTLSPTSASSPIPKHYRGSDDDDSSESSSSDSGRPSIFPAATRPLADFFTVDDSKPLGYGHSGFVRRCTDKSTGQSFAVKTFFKDRLATDADREAVRREVELMDRVAGHPGVVRVQGLFEDRRHAHVVMDLCEAGELFDHVLTRRRLPERDAALLFRQVASAVAFCHARGVVHRDLKLENVLLHETPEALLECAAGGAGGTPLLGPLVARVADFGLAECLESPEGNKLLTGAVGSPFYMAPEVLTSEYDYSADVWSLGVILYILLSGVPPFWGPTDLEVFEAVLRGHVDFSGSVWAVVSADVKGLIRCMLQRDPRRRPSAAKVLSHPWLMVHAFGGKVVRRRAAAAGGESAAVEGAVACHDGKEMAVPSLPACIAAGEIGGRRALTAAVVDGGRAFDGGRKGMTMGRMEGRAR